MIAGLRSAVRRGLVRLGLLFADPAEEQAFVAVAVGGSAARTRSAMLLGCFVYYVFFVWDRLIDPSGAHATHLIRAGVVLFALLPLTALTFWSWAKQHLESVLLAYCTIPAVFLAIVYSKLAGGYVQGAAGMIIVILFVASLLPLRMSFFAIFGATAWSSFAIQEMHAAGSSSGASIVNNLYVGTALALALFSVIVRERQARAQFRTATGLRTAQRKAEAALAELQDAKASLIQAEKLAALGQLVAGVAHEVNTPIGISLTTSTTMEIEIERLAVSVTTGRVLRSELDRSLKRLAEGCRILTESLRRTADLIGSFKQVAVDQAGDGRKRFRVAQSLRDILTTLAPTLRHHGHEADVECPENLEIEGQPGALAQIVTNLVINAATHGYPTGGSGRITVGVQLSGPASVRLVVADDGVGIPRDLQEKVFEPFYTTNRLKGSTGLGLHIVHNIVHSTLKGRLFLEGGPGQGTRVVIVFPQHGQEPQVALAAAQA